MPSRRILASQPFTHRSSIVVNEGIRLTVLDGLRAVGAGRDGDQEGSRLELGDVPFLHGATDHRDPPAAQIGESVHIAHPWHEDQRCRHAVRVRELRHLPTLVRRRDRGGEQVDPSRLQDAESCRRADGHELDAPVIVEEDPREESRQVDLEADRRRWRSARTPSTVWPGTVRIWKIISHSRLDIPV